MITKYKRFNYLCMDTAYRGMIGMIFGLSIPKTEVFWETTKWWVALDILKSVQNVGQQAGF